MFDNLCAQFYAWHGARDHEDAQTKIYVSQAPMSPCSDRRVAGDVTQVGAYHKVHRHTQHEHHWPRQEAATDTKETQHADDETNEPKKQGINGYACDGKIHQSLYLPFTHFPKRSRPEVTRSSNMA